VAYPATFLSLQEAVIGKLRLDATADRDRVKDWLNQVQAQVCLETEALQKADTMPATANVASYTLPDAVLRMRKIVSAPESSPSSFGVPLQEVTLDEILTLRQSGQVAYTNQGAPAKYALDGMTQLELYPTPAAPDVLLFYYVYLPPPMVADAAEPELPEPYASKILEYGALAEGADFLSDPDQDRYRALFEDWLRRFRVHLSRRRGSSTGQFRVLGSPLVGVGRDIDLGD
jgi:hypothetical protein